jgi:hypothetical protein
LSKIIDAVRTELSGKRAPLRFIDMATKVDLKPRPLEYAVNYRIQSTFEVTGSCREDDLQFIRDNFVRSLREELYSDLKPALLTLEREIYNENREGLRECMEVIKKEIWG